ncbi:MAG: hypothetical protein KGL59_15600, partial [Acidobacteriota bacterium]|nr:hypothetical protein [Acidobacteriota bacterium]
MFFPMIQKSQIMPLVLARCPGFLPRWEKHLEFWKGEEAGIYNDMVEFAQYIVDAYERGDREPVAAACGLMEELLIDGD